MNQTEDISPDFILCVQKLLSSISTLRKHLSSIASVQSEESIRKLKAIKEAIISLAPAIETANQLDSASTLVDHLSSEYSSLYNDYKQRYSLIMTNTVIFNEYKQAIEDLSIWLTLTNANIQQALEFDDKQQTSINIKNLDELNKYESLVEHAIELNQTMATDLPDEQAKEMIKEIDDIKEQWKIFIGKLNIYKERNLSSESANLTDSSSANPVTEQNEILVNFIQSLLTLGKELIDQHENNHANTLIEKEQLLSKIKECQHEMDRLKNLHANTSQPLIAELTTLATSMATARIQLENCIEQQREFATELDIFIGWLKALTCESEIIDNQEIQLTLNERQGDFNKLIKSNQQNDFLIEEKIEYLIEMWSNLTLKVAGSPPVVTKHLSSAVPLASSSPPDIIEQAQNLLDTIVQLGNRHEIEQHKNKIQAFLTRLKSSQASDSNTKLPHTIHDELANRHLILQQMLIDTSHIDHLRVNLVSHFNTENNTVTATNEIKTLIDNYPKEMTNQIRQWLTEQQRPRVASPLVIVDNSKTIGDFEKYFKDLEENFVQYQQNEHNQAKLKKLIQLIENRPNLSENLNDHDKQHAANLLQQFDKIKKLIADIRKNSLIKKTNIDNTVGHIDALIKRTRDVEEQIEHNLKQPIHDYEKLIRDCQRIISELNQNLRMPVEEAINNGKRLYSLDSKDYSNVESADDTGGGSLLSPPSSPLKKHSDLTLRKVRRHVLQLAQHWKNANSNIQYRLNLLQRAQTAVEELRHKCDRLHAHLLETELAYAHKPQIKALNVEQVPAEIEQAKQLLSKLISCKPSIHDILQLAQTVEREYDIHVTNRAQELNERWEHSVTLTSQRIQSLQDSIKNTASDIYSSSVEYPWQRAAAINKIPYYINHSDQTTSWDHPKMHELMTSFGNFNDIRFSAYRTAMKLRTLQKCLCLDLTSLSNIISVFAEHEVADSINKTIDVVEILDYLQKIFEKTSNEYPHFTNVICTVDLTLNWLLNIYDINRTGTIRLLSMKMALALLSRGYIEEKYRYLFSLGACTNNNREVLDRQRLSVLFQQAIVIPKQLGEVAAFGGSSVEPSVQSCFEYAHNPDVITADDFLEWVKLEPQSLVWLPVMHRLAASEVAKHEARCNICKMYPILGFRYRSLRHFNCDICQNCFFSGKQTKIFKMADPLQEYYTETTSSEDIRDFFRIFKNKVWAKTRKTPKLGYLPLPHVFDNTVSTSEQQILSSPALASPSTTPSKPHIEVTPLISSLTESDDEHMIIAQHCRNLNNAVSKVPHFFPNELLVHSSSLDHEERVELEAIICDLEDENRLLQNEYERLCQEHREQSLILNEQQEQLLFNDNQLEVYNDRKMLREAKQLRQHKIKLEQRMKILEEHNKQLGKQMERSKQLLSKESPVHTLRRSVDRNLERQPNLLTIDNLFHMADDLNRAIGDLVSVITEPQSTASSNFCHQIMSSILARTLIKRSLILQCRGIALSSLKGSAKPEGAAQPSKQTALYNFHVNNSGRMVSFCGWTLPVQYSASVIQSHLYTRSHASIFDVSHMLQVKIKGADRVRFFEKLVVCDLENLPENCASLTLYTSEKGGILDDLIVTKTNDGYLFVVSNAGRATEDLAHLHTQLAKAKRQGLDVDIEVLSDQALLALQGPRSAEILQPYLGSSVDLSKVYFMQSRLTKFNNDPSIPCRINRSGYTGEDGFEISISNSNVERVLNALLSSGVAQMAGLGPRDSLRLEAGLCLYGNDIDEQTTPVEADLTWTIAKRRRQLADFPGAKVILDQIEKGPPRKRVGIKSTGSCPRSGAEIRSGRDEKSRIIGKVTSGCPAPSLKLLNVGMAYVETPLSKIGNKVNINIRNRIIEAEIVKMPFVPAQYCKPQASKKK
ncbi:unnamed protein product [Rotaria socialis]|uniref:aminomethyltransferase n=2 Tax=Rotaria socialis TaxID=392032 RepID=A0A820W382_9BILA|nr:unnamed protein product [Rotaria socialis]